MPPFQRLGGALEALADQGGGDQTVARSPADLEALGPGAVREELQAAGALAQHGAERAFDLPGVEPEHAGGRRRRAERAAGRRRVEPAVVMCSGGQGERDPAGDLISRDDGGQHVRSARAGHFASRERRRDDGSAGMQRAGRVRIVEVERVGEGAVQEGGTRRRVARRIAEHPVVPGREPERPRGLEQRGRALRVIAGADDVADEIEDEKARALHDLGRQAVEPNPGGKSREFRGDAHRWPPLSPSLWSDPLRLPSGPPQLSLM